MRQFSRKIFLAALAFSFLLLAACGRQSEEQKSDKSLYEHGLELISLMEEMAGSEGYMSILSTSEDIKNILLDVGKGDFSNPKTVYRITLSGTAIFDMAETDIGQLSYTLQENLKSRMASVVSTQINALAGTAELASSAVCTAEKVFVYPELKESQIYLYLFDNAVPATVTFTPGEDGAVSAKSSFILLDDFETYLASETNELLESFGVKIEDITQQIP